MKSREPRTKEDFFKRTMDFSMTLSSVVAVIVVSIYGGQNFYTKLSVSAFTISFLLWLEHYLYYSIYLTNHKKLHLKIGTHCQIGGYFAMILGLLYLFKGYEQDYAYAVLMGYMVLYYIPEKIVDYAHYIRETATQGIKTEQEYVAYVKNHPKRLLIPSFVLSVATTGLIISITPPRQLILLGLLIIFLLIIYGTLIIFYVKLHHMLFSKIQKSAEKLL